MRNELITGLLAMIESGKLKVRIDFDFDYGVDHKKGWSVTVDGSVVVSFEKYLSLALTKALLATWHNAEFVQEIQPILVQVPRIGRELDKESGKG